MKDQIMRFVLAIVGACLLQIPAYGFQEVKQLEWNTARYELEKVEQKISHAAGQRIELNKYDKKTFNTIMELAKRDPDNPKVAELVERAKKAYKATQGIVFEITPEMLAYRTSQAKVKETINGIGKEAWAAFSKNLASEGSILKKSFPVPLPPEFDPLEVEGRHVVLQDIDYEQSLFVQHGVNWLAKGSPKDGYYWIDAGSREFNQLYEALGRYREKVQNEIKQTWTIVGIIEGADYLSPESTANRGAASYLGWRVKPTAVYIPEHLFLNLSDELGATFVGENEIAEFKRYSVTDVQPDIEPLELVRTYITAIKEKNWDLHLECLDPELRQQGTQIQGLRYNWHVQQKGLEKVHCHAEPFEVGEIEVVQGSENKSIDDFFGDGESSTASKVPRIEKVSVTVRLFNEKGLQTVRPRTVTLTRRESGRWYISGGATLTF